MGQDGMDCPARRSCASLCRGRAGPERTTAQSWFGVAIRDHSRNRQPIAGHRGGETMKSRWEEDMLQKLSILSAALRKYFRTSALTAAGSALLLAGGPAAAEQPPDEMFAPTKAITLPSPQNITNFDNSFGDPVISQYFLADRTNKAGDVVDTHS